MLLECMQMLKVVLLFFKVLNTCLNDKVEYLQAEEIQFIHSIILTTLPVKSYGGVLETIPAAIR